MTGRVGVALLELFLYGIMDVRSCSFWIFSCLDVICDQTGMVVFANFNTNFFIFTCILTVRLI